MVEKYDMDREESLRQRLDIAFPNEFFNVWSVRELEQKLCKKFEAVIRRGAVL